MAKLSNDYDTVLRVNIAEGATVFVPQQGQRTKFDMQSLSQVSWFNHVPTEYSKPIEFHATPINILDLPEQIGRYDHIPSEYNRSDWYFLEKIVPEPGLANEYVVHGDDLIPLNASYPTIISLLPHLQETLALAQLEAAKLAQKPELRLGVADRLMALLTNICMNVQR